MDFLGFSFSFGLFFPCNLVEADYKIGSVDIEDTDTLSALPLNAYAGGRQFKCLALGGDHDYIIRIQNRYRADDFAGPFLGTINDLSVRGRP